MPVIAMALVVPLAIYLVAACLPRGRGGFVVMAVMLVAGGLAWITAGPPAGGADARSVGPARVTLMMAGIGLALGAFAQFLRLHLPAGASPAAYPGVVIALGASAVLLGVYLLRAPV
jgi:hypothetical protein